jgi:hypothetical protein
MTAIPAGTQFVGIAADKDLTTKKAGPASTEVVGYTIEDLAAAVKAIQSTTTTTTTTAS